MAVLAGEPDLAAGEEVVEAAGVLAIAESEQDPGRDGALGEGSPQERERGDADSTTDEDRPRGPRGDPTRLREVVAEGAVDPHGVAALELAEAIGPGPDSLDQEVEAPGAVLLDRVGHRERPRQVGALAALLPVALGGEHVELARQRRRPLLIAQREDAVAARVMVLDDPQSRRPNGGLAGSGIRAGGGGMPVYLLE